MVVSQVCLLLSRQFIPVIPAALVSLLVLCPQSQHIPTHTYHGKHGQRELRAVAAPIMRRLGLHEQATRNHTACLAKADGGSRRDRRLPEATDVVDDGAVHERHADVRAGVDEEQRKVFSAHGHVVLTEVDDPAGESHAVAEHGEGVAVLEVIRHQGEYQGGHAGGHEDRDAHHLVVTAGPGGVELGDDRGREERDAVEVADCGDVDEDAGAIVSA